MPTFFEAIATYPSGRVIKVRHVPSNAPVRMPHRNPSEAKDDLVVVSTADHVREMLMNSPGMYAPTSPVSGEWPETVEILEARDAKPSDVLEGKAVINSLAADPGKVGK